MAQFTEVHEALAGHSTATCKHGGAIISKALKQFEFVDIQLPDTTTCNTPNDIQKITLQEKVKKANDRLTAAAKSLAW